MENKINHIAFIIDGNRRYAMKNLFKPWQGHEKGAEKVDDVLEWVKELGIKETTIYCLSNENLNRDKKELDFLFKLFEKFFGRYINDSRIDRDKVRVRFIGRIHLVPENIQELIKKFEDKTKNNDNYIVNFAFAYGGRQEIIDAVKKIVKNKEEINEENFEKCLYLQSHPDLIIRTGNAARTSNFMPWQSIYSEWIFLDKLWPEFTKSDLIQCIEDFHQRKRNFGK